MFALQQAGGRALQAAGLRLSPLALGNGTSQFDLTLYVVDGAGGLVAEMEYKTALWSAATVDRLLTAYEELLAAAVACPAIPISRLPLPADLLPRQAVEAGAAVQEPAPDGGESARARQDRLASRLARLSSEQREALERRLRGSQ